MEARAALDILIPVTERIGGAGAPRTLNTMELLHRNQPFTCHRLSPWKFLGVPPAQRVVTNSVLC